MITDKERAELLNLRKRVCAQRDEIKRITAYAKRLEGLLYELKDQVTRSKNEALR